MPITISFMYPLTIENRLIAGLKGASIGGYISVTKGVVPATKTMTLSVDIDSAVRAVDTIVSVLKNNS